ncbi:MAG: NAD(P)-dependent glycerol-3-phosphate dehydrogenase [Thermotogaceae bacterium]|nr:NAD(P)-dependent glycerol-3-phosphate dehydrogenase [Thermotogaceae bacterium]
MKVSVIGGGSWGTAIAKLLHIKGHDVRIWARRKKVVEALRNGENPYYLSGVTLPKFRATDDLDDAIKESKLLYFAIPAQAVRQVLEAISELPEDAIVINLAKGMEIKSGKRMEEVFREVLGDVRYATISGPSHAEEVSRDIPTSVVVASKDEDVAKLVQYETSTISFRVYRSTDVTGVEIAGALKNIIAVAAGVIDGMGRWDNSKAALITRALSEITRFGIHFGARKETFMGLAGIGDLIVTCTSQYSRNRYVGEMIGRGKKLDEILKEMSMVAEGVYTAEVAYEISRREGLYTPIIDHVYKVLYEGMDVSTALHSLLNRPLKEED